MIRLSNGHEFAVMAASGALAYGRGWWWERFGLIPAGILDPRGVTVVTKTLTYEPRRGNLRTWVPWRSVRPNFRTGGCTNAVGLTNPGWEWWYRTGYDRYVRNGNTPVVVSVRPETRDEAWRMGFHTACDQAYVRGLEFNASCPNVHSPPGDKVRWVVDLFDTLSGWHVPVGVKLGYTDPFHEVCEALDGRAAWFTLVNAVPWATVHGPRVPSPLGRHTGGAAGAVSGPEIGIYARGALGALRGKLRTPIVTGGGVMTPDEAVWRLEHGADAVALGTVFLTRPWRVRGIVRAVKEWEAKQCQTKS